MEHKKQSGLSRILEYAGGHKRLTLLGCALSALSAVLGLIPYVCVWLVARAALSGDRGANLSRWGWIAVALAIISIFLYFAALMCTHIAAFRTARNMRSAAMRAPDSSRSRARESTSSSFSGFTGLSR